MKSELTSVAGRMGRLVAENAQIDRQQRRTRSTETEHRYWRNQAEIIDCQITLLTARIATRPALSSDDLRRGLSNLYRTRAVATRRIQTSAPRDNGWRNRAQQALSAIGRS